MNNHIAIVFVPFRKFFVFILVYFEIIFYLCPNQTNNYCMKQSILSILFLLLPMLACADAVEIDGIYYFLENVENAKVTRNPNKYSGDVVIPETVVYYDQIYNVTSIDYAAFLDCVDVTSVTIPNTVTSIGIASFANCSGLSSIIIPESVLTIGDDAFSGCSNLNSVNIPNSVTSIGKSAFSGCTNLSSITLPEGITIIDSNTFYKCSSLTSVYIPNSVTTIGQSAFISCTSLNSVIIGNNVTFIGNSAFNECCNLSSITIPISVTTIENYAFGYCRALASIKVEEGNPVYDSRENCNAIIKTDENKLISGCQNTTIPNSVTSIAQSAFSGCSALTSITIPSSVTTIENYAFGECSALASIMVEEGNPVYDSRDNCNAIIKTAENELILGCQNTVIPNNIISIGFGAFLGCSNLKSLSIPNSVLFIGQSAFSGCSSLTSLNIPDGVTSIDILAFGGCSGLISVTIGNGVTSIGDDLFSMCSNLTSVTIGNSVTFISRVAFGYCSEMKDFYCYTEEVPETHQDAFYYTPIEEVTLHVPESSINAYKTLEPWKNFKEIVAIGSDPSSINDVNIRKESKDVYSLDGHMIGKSIESLDNLPKGVYIINGRKIIK